MLQLHVTAPAAPTLEPRRYVKDEYIMCVCVGVCVCVWVCVCVEGGGEDGGVGSWKGHASWGAPVGWVGGGAERDFVGMGYGLSLLDEHPPARRCVEAGPTFMP